MLTFQIMSGRRPRRPAAAATPPTEKGPQRARKRPRPAAVTSTAAAATASAEPGEQDLFARVAANSELLQKSIDANVELTKQVALLVGQVSQLANNTAGTAGAPRLEPGPTTSTPGDTSVHAAGAGGGGAQSAMGVIDEAVDSLTTERARKRLVSAATPLHSGVPAKTREKIWSNEFVDFQVFSGRTATPKSLRIVATGSEDFTFALSNGETAKDLTLQEWLSAWDKFSTVYLAKFPLEGINLIRYAAIIKDLAAHNADWRQYDREFRQMRADSGGLDWCEVHWQSWLEAMHTPGRRPFRDGNPGAAAPPPQAGKPATRAGRAFAAGGPQSNPHPRGVCWFYHDGVRCQGCQYNHRCYKCGGPHPVFRCGGPDPATGGRAFGSTGK